MPEMLTDIGTDGAWLCQGCTGHGRPVLWRHRAMHRAYSTEAASAGLSPLWRTAMRRIDLYEKRLDLCLDPQTLKERQKGWKPPERNITGVLARYARTVEQANHGAVQR